MPRKNWQQRVYSSRLDEVEDALKAARGYSLSAAVAEALDQWCRLKEAERGSVFPEPTGEVRKGRWRDSDRDDPTDARLSVTLDEDLLVRFYAAVFWQEHPNDYVGNALDDALAVWCRYRRLVERQNAT